MKKKERKREKTITHSEKKTTEEKKKGRFEKSLMKSIANSDFMKTHMFQNQNP